MESENKFVLIEIAPVNSDPSSPQNISAGDDSLTSEGFGESFVFKDIAYSTNSDAWSLAWQGGTLEGTSDGFHFAYSDLAGPAEASARVNYVSGESGFASAGVMFRASLALDSPFVSIAFTANDELVVKLRDSVGAEVQSSVVEWLELPEHARLVNTGNAVRAFVSENGFDWRLVDQVEVSLPDNYVYGLFCEGGDLGEQVVCEFSNLSHAVIELDRFGDSYLVEDFGSLVTYSDVLESDLDGSFAIETVGGTLESGVDNGSYASVVLSQDFELIARLENMTDGSSSSLAGLMVREGLVESGPYYSIYQNRNGEILTDVREEIGGERQKSEIGSQPRPVYFRIVKAGDSLASYHSVDGESWDLASESVVAQDMTFNVGIFASGIDATEYVEALFDLVRLELGGNPIIDSDGDGMSDDYEIANGLDPNDPSDADGDLDGDGLTNLEEYQLGTNPNSVDTDGDGMPDKWEVDHGLNPALDDSGGDGDGDGLTNFSEYNNGTSPSDYYNGVANRLTSLTNPLGNLGKINEISVLVADESGTPLVNAPVEFFPVVGGHGVAASPDSMGQESVIVRSDSDGIARAYLRPLNR